MGYQIITDTCCDFPARMYKELNLRAVPLSVSFRGQDVFEYDEAWLKDLFSRGDRGVSTAGEVLGAAALTAIFLLSILFLMGQTYNPFIYFRF